MLIKLKQPSPVYDDLTPDSIYRVIGIEADDYRLINDRGKPYLYPSTLFEIVEATEPNDWVIETGDDGERYAYPPPLNRPGFFEDFFDGETVAVTAFWQTVNRKLAAA